VRPEGPTSPPSPPPTAQPPAGPPPGRRRLLGATAGVAALVATLFLGIAIGRGTADGPATSSTTGVQGLDQESPGPTQEVQVPDELAWAPPELDDPETVEVTQDERDLRLDDDTDYVVEMPDEPVDGAVTISGGRDVVLIGGEIRIDEESDSDNGQRGLYLKDQTGTIHVEGLLISGDELAEGINLSQRAGATVQLQNVRVETVHGSRDGHHADVIQTWAGPSVLRIDRLTGSTTYQGFFLLPMQFLEEEPELFDLRNVNIVGEDAAYLLWRDGAAWPLDVDNVWVSTDKDPEDRGAFLWARGDDAEDAWDDVEVGTPPGGDFVPADSVGVGYSSPGYLDSTGD